MQKNIGVELLPCMCGGKLSDVVLMEREENNKKFVLCGNCGKVGPDDDLDMSAAIQWNVSTNARLTDCQI